jgi:long-chain acyl-CoA synthetase
MNKVWLKNYPHGVPAEINPNEYPSLTAVFESSCERFAAQGAFSSLGRTIAYAEFDRRARHFAAWLQQSAKLQRGDRIAIMLPNVLQYPIALFGALRAGLTVVNTNPLYTARELEHQLSDSGAKAILILENFAHTLEQVIERTSIEHVLITGVGDQLGWPKSAIVNLVVRHVRKQVPPYELPGALRFNDALEQGQFLPFEPVTTTHDDIAFLQYTGGTTGVAKGATLTHRNVAANVVQMDLWMKSCLGERPDHVMVTALPLYHIFALTVCAMLMGRLGACQLLIANPRDIPGFVKILKGSKFTLMSGVNTLYNALANSPDIKAVDFSKVVLCVSGGMATQAAVARKWKELSGCPIVEGYGLSETSPVVCANRLDIEEFTGTIGYPVPSTDVSIRDADGKVLPPGEPGELCVKGPQVMRGYWNKPEETAKVTTADGYFRTGDIAVLLPDGKVKIVDRMKDMVLVSGFNVYPNEVEDVLATHPGVLEVAVIGVPDEHSGEAVAAYVVKKEPNLTVEDLRAHARANLTGYKIPRVIEFRDSLPKTNVGKVLRRALRDEVLGKG